MTNSNRGIAGVVASISTDGEGNTHITLDDVSRDSIESKTWSHDVFVTTKAYDKSQILDLDLPEEEYAALGHYVFARLRALHKNELEK